MKTAWGISLLYPFFTLLSKDFHFPLKIPCLFCCHIDGDIPSGCSGQREDIGSKFSAGKFYLEIIQETKIRAGGYNSVVEHMRSMYKVLGSI